MNAHAPTEGKSNDYKG